MPSDKFFGKGKERILGKKWDWEKFKTTLGFPVSNKLIDWIIGQDKALEELKLCLLEWVHKLKTLQEKEWYKDWLDPDKEKRPLTKILSPGPFLLLLGEPGTGKSLLGKALAEILTELYEKEDIKQFDVLCWPNKIIPSNPKISLHFAGEGKKLYQEEKKKEARKNLKRKIALKILQGFLLGLGISLLTVALYWIFAPWIYNWNYGMSITPVQEYFRGNFLNYLAHQLPGMANLLVAGGSLCFSAVFMMWFGRIFFRQNISDFSGSEQTKAPKLLIDRSSKEVPFVDATGQTGAQMWGSISWDPYQSGGLSTPQHQRVVAGAIHRANLGVLFIDEIKNLKPEDAITLLTVLEEGCLPITVRDRYHAGTAAMAVSTQPVPALFFLVAAGNYDSIELIHPALMDRLLGYGRVVKMNDEIDDTVENRRKYVQFIAQEVKRFNLLPFTRGACIEVIKEARRRTNKRDKLTTKFRPLINIIKVASILAIKEGSERVERRHVKEAIQEHCKSIEKQLLEEYLVKDKKFLLVKPKGVKRDTIYGLAVRTWGDEEIGTVLRVKGQLIKSKSDGKFVVTGIQKNNKYINASIEKVKAVILRECKVDLEEKYRVNIDFSQSYFVDGPSAGVTLTLLLIALLTGKKIRQDIAITGEINISGEDEIEITPVGGVHQKILAAQNFGFKEVIIPYLNYKYSIDPSDYEIKVSYGKTLKDYMKKVLVDDKGKNKTKRQYRT